MKRAERPEELSTSTLLAVLFLLFYVPIAYYFGWPAVAGIQVDFPSYYYAAQVTFIQWVAPYGLSAFHAFSNALNHKVNPYLYPPPSLFLFWPLKFLSLASAEASFLVVSHLCYLGSVWLMLFRLVPIWISGREREIALVLSLTYLLCSDAVLATLWIGQVNLIVLFFICLTLVGLRMDWPPLYVAAPLTIAILLKTYPLLLLLPILFRKQFRVAGFTVSLLGIFAIASILLLPAGIWNAWLTKVVPLAYAEPALAGGYPSNQSLNGFVMRIFVDNGVTIPLLPYAGLAKPLITALALLLVGVTASLAYLLARKEGACRVSEDELAAFLLLSFLIAPLSWDHHMVYVMPAAIWLIARIVCRRQGGIVPGLLGAALLMTAWKLPLEPPLFRVGWATLLLSSKFFAVFGMWLYFMRQIYIRARPAYQSSFNAN